MILDSVVDIDKAAANLAFSVNLYSGQMCTAPQNFTSRKGHLNTNGIVSFSEFAQKLVDNINGLIDNPKAGPFVLGANSKQKTSERVVERRNLRVSLA